VNITGIAVGPPIPGARFAHSRCDRCCREPALRRRASIATRTRLKSRAAGVMPCAPRDTGDRPHKNKKGKRHGVLIRTVTATRCGYATPSMPAHLAARAEEGVSGSKESAGVVTGWLSADENSPSMARRSPAAVMPGCPRSEVVSVARLPPKSARISPAALSGFAIIRRLTLTRHRSK